MGQIDRRSMVLASWTRPQILQTALRASRIDDLWWGSYVDIPPPRPMRADEESGVRALYTLCHPDWAARPAEWYVAYPTLVLMGSAAVMGYTSFSVSPAPHGPTTLYGNDVGIHPDYRGRGYGRQLADARLDYGRAVGATGFIGLTEEDNLPMTRIFQRQGFHPCQRLPGYYGVRAAVVWAETF